MCEPATIVAGVTAISGAAKTVLDYSAQSSQSDKNKQAALQNEQLQMQQLGLRQMQEQQAANQSIYQADLQARRADASARVMAGASGVAGGSVDAVLEDLDRQRLMNQQTINTNYQNQADQIGQQKLQIQANTQNQINSMPPPNPWGSVLSIAGTGLSSYDAYKRNMPSIGKG